jgi:hypothetical protein
MIKWKRSCNGLHLFYSIFFYSFLLPSSSYLPFFMMEVKRSFLWVYFVTKVNLLRWRLCFLPIEEFMKLVLLIQWAHYRSPRVVALTIPFEPHLVLLQSVALIYEEVLKFISLLCKIIPQVTSPNSQFIYSCLFRCHFPPFALRTTPPDCSSF